MPAPLPIDPPLSAARSIPRKSTEEGLEQAFNSFHSQREACEAYVLSQQHEGWSLIPITYDDGGFSGGTMDRPALETLLADIRAGQIQKQLDDDLEKQVCGKQARKAQLEEGDEDNSDDR